MVQLARLDNASSPDCDSNLLWIRRARENAICNAVEVGLIEHAAHSCATTGGYTGCVG